jgi:hypothetical protein
MNNNNNNNNNNNSMGFFFVGFFWELKQHRETGNPHIANKTLHQEEE